MGKRANFSPINALAVRKSGAHASRKIEDRPLISIKTSCLPPLPHAATSTSAHKKKNHSVAKTRLSPFPLQDHLPTLLRSYTQPCDSMYAWCVVSSKTKLWEQLPTILNEVKILCRQYNKLSDHSPNQSLNDESGISNQTKANSKPTPGGDKSTLQSGVIERVSLLITFFFPAASNHFLPKQEVLSQPKPKSKKEIIVTPKERRKLWKVLMCNITNTFPVLLAASRTDLMCAVDPQPAALLLSFLYNLLQALHGKPLLKKVIESCIMLGLYKICTNILMVHTSVRAFSVKGSCTGEVQLYYRCRVIEAVALIMTLTNHFDPKSHLVIRVTGIMERLLYSLGVVVDLLDIRLRNFLDALSSLDDLDKTMDIELFREKLLQFVENVVRLTSFLSSACTHLCMSIFSAAKSSSNTNELGARCVGVCAKLIAILSRSLYLEIPIHFCRVFTTQSDALFLLCKLPEDSVENEALHNTVPSWVFLWSHSLEVSMFWAVALLQRVCERCKAHIACSMEAHKHNALLSIYTVLWIITQDLGKCVENGEVSGKGQTPASFSPPQWENRMCMVRTALIAIDTLLKANRKLGLEELHAVGGVASLVKLVLQLPLAGVDEWWHFYILCCSFYSLSLLPSSSENESAYAMNSRVPKSKVSPLGSRLSGKKVSSSARISTLLDDNETYRSLAPEAKSLPMSPSQHFVMEASSGEDASTSQKGLGISDLMSHVEKLVFTDTPDLLPVDQCPAWFSTELNNGFIAPRTELPHESAIELPWSFTDPPLPPTNYFLNHAADEVMNPLEVLSDSHRIEILVHHISRLLHLEGICDDSSEDSANHHRYHVVYDRTRNVEEGGRRTERKTSEDALIDTVADDTPIHTRAPKSVSSLTFRSNFPSGNLQRAILVSEDEYDLILSWDTSTNSFTQWFCFSVSDYEPGKTYRFNILNMEKNGSLFNEGQRVLMLHDAFTESFSFPADSALNISNPRKWRRTGELIYYFSNPYGKPPRRTLRDKLQQAPSCNKTLTRRRINQSAEAKTKKQAPRSRRVPFYKNRSRDPSITTACKSTSLASSHTEFGKKVEPSASVDNGANEVLQKTYFTLSFKVTMPTEVPHKVYIANCFPYTYSEVLGQLERLSSVTHTKDDNKSTDQPTNRRKPSNFTIQQLCRTPGGLPVPFVTATAFFSCTDGRRYAPEEIRRRPVIILTARVHPGETNSSWVMHGILEALLMPADLHVAHNNEDATNAERLHQVVDDLLHHFVFKIIPILNPDGVVMGNHRCSIFGADLNRDYLHPDLNSNPVVYSLKQLLRHMITTEKRSVMFYTDFHGHSCAKNFMIYGCTEDAVSSLKKKKKRKRKISGREDGISPSATFNTTEAVDPLTGEGFCNDHKGFPRKDVSPEKFFPTLLSHLCPSFALPQCLFSAQKCKKTTGRLVIYMQFGIRMSYTVEVSMMGGLGAFFKAETSPLLSLPDDGCHSDNLNSASTVSGKAIQTHYSQDSFINMGRSFLVALHVLCLLYMKNNLSPVSSASGPDVSAESVLVGADLPHRVRQLILDALSELYIAGNGKELQKQNPLEGPATSLSPFSSTIAAGSYSLLTRAERRSAHLTGGPFSAITGNRLSSLQGLVMEEPESACSVTSAQLYQLMNYLFARCHHVEEELYSDSSDRQSEENEDRNPPYLVSNSLLWPLQTLNISKSMDDEELSDSVESTLNDGSISEEAVDRDGIATDFIEEDVEDKDRRNQNTEYEGDFDGVWDNDFYIPTSLFTW